MEHGNTGSLESHAAKEDLIDGLLLSVAVIDKPANLTFSPDACIGRWADEEPSGESEDSCSHGNGENNKSQSMNSNVPDLEDIGESVVGAVAR